MIKPRPIRVALVVDAIQKAGGITQRADLLALIQEGRQSQNPDLFDGDVIRLARRL